MLPLDAADCEQFHDAGEREILPVVRELQAERRRQLTARHAASMDLAVDR